jgi:hypothetical protein
MPTKPMKVMTTNTNSPKEQQPRTPTKLRRATTTNINKALENTTNNNNRALGEHDHEYQTKPRRAQLGIATKPKKIQP